MGKNRGDTIDVSLAYTIDGEPITEGQFDEIEVYIGENRYTLEGETISTTVGNTTTTEIIHQIVWDSELGMYTIFVSQEDSFKLTTKTEYQVRFKLGTKVFSSNIKYMPIGKTLSNEVI